MTSSSSFICKILSKNFNSANIGNEIAKSQHQTIHPVSGNKFYELIFTTKNPYFVFNNITLSKEESDSNEHFIGVYDPDSKVVMDYYYFKDGDNYYMTSSIDFMVVYREINPDIEDMKSMVRNTEKMIIRYK
jgi:hypothetical protein